MTKEQIEQKAHEIGWQISKHYDPNVCKQEWCEMAAKDMANWLLQNIQIVKLHNAHAHDFFENHKFLCLEEQKRQLLLSLKNYIKVEEELTDFGVIVKMEIKVIK